eukprot:7771600-Alexandrium_andersonii.AAC.1
MSSIAVPLAGTCGAVLTGHFVWLLNCLHTWRGMVATAGLGLGRVDSCAGLRARVWALGRGDEGG